MVIGIFTYFFALETTLAERQFFRALAKLVGKRAARLSSCGIAAIVKKMGYLERGCAVGADGSLYNVRHLQPSTCSSADSPFIVFVEVPRLPRPDSRRPSGYLWYSGKVSALCVRVLFVCQLRITVSRKIVTYHAEDGSGIGSAIVAGLSLYLLWVYMLIDLTAMTKARKDAGLYATV